MTHEQLERRQEQAMRHALVISRTEEGFRVRSATDSTTSYLVSGSLDAPSGTCPDFRFHEDDPAWRCKHILAVLNQVSGANGRASETDFDEVEKELALRQEGRFQKQEQKRTARGSAAQMLIKRSVSPDGRINCLSIEFACAVEGLSKGEITARALAILEFQDEIVRRFLNAHPHEGDQRTAVKQSEQEAISAQMISIGGMDTQWGRRLFITIRANSRTFKLFGSRKQLAQAVTAAGFPDLAERIEEGAYLNLPCRVITRPSEDGRFLNVERVLPIEPPPPQKRAR